jgi:glycerol-3-phosphate dehydrogenase
MIMDRNESLQRAAEDTLWDIAIIGGGASGLGAAVESATRGLKTILLEKKDFAEATSSRSTKLVHGGVRYLEQGNVSLVRDALRERASLLENAPHIVNPLAFVVPCYRWWEGTYYRTGLKAYDWLAGNDRFPGSTWMNAKAVSSAIPTLKETSLKGGVCYYDGQFDDARLAITLARTAASRGAVVLNYAPVQSLTISGSRVEGLEFIDAETSKSFCIKARKVINATGIFVDEVRRWSDRTAKPLLAYSQGIHLVLPKRFLTKQTAIIVPKTKDGRVIFIIPWHDRVVVGTTDTPISGADYDPQPQSQEIDFLLETAADYLRETPSRSDVVGSYVGIRPLVQRGAKSTSTAKLSRDHTIENDTSGLLTITGGKWTTYRKMGEDVIDMALKTSDIKALPSCTATLKLFGGEAAASPQQFEQQGNAFDPLRYYGSEANEMRALLRRYPDLSEPIVDTLPYRKIEVMWGVRYEMARTAEDILHRRTRCACLDKLGTEKARDKVVRWIQEERDGVLPKS